MKHLIQRFNFTTSTNFINQRHIVGLQKQILKYSSFFGMISNINQTDYNEQLNYLFNFNLEINHYN